MGCTTRLAPSNCAPPGASSPSPVRCKPNSYCLSRFSLDSLSLDILSTKSMIAVLSLFWSTSSTILAKCASLCSWLNSISSRRTKAPPSSVSSTSANSFGIATVSPCCSSSIIVSSDIICLQYLISHHVNFFGVVNPILGKLHILWHGIYSFTK